MSVAPLTVALDTARILLERLDMLATAVWLRVDVTPSEPYDLDRLVSYHYAIWRATGALHTVIDAAVSDDPIVADDITAATAAAPPANSTSPDPPSRLRYGYGCG